MAGGYRHRIAISPFVQGLRAKVGSDLLLLPSATTLPRDDDGRVLLVRTSDDGTWATIGGLIEPNERPADAARRETKEEAGVDVELGELIGVFGGPGYQITYPGGDKTAYVVSVYDATVTTGTPEPDGEETTEVGWFSRAELEKADLSPFTRVLLRDVGLID